MRHLVLALCFYIPIFVAKNKKPDIVYNSQLHDSSTIIRDIKIKGCSKAKKQIISAILKISPGDIINLQSGVINNNIRNILDNCSFVQDIQCTFKNIDKHNIDIIFTVQEAPLIVDITFNNIDNEDLKKSCEKDCFGKSCNDIYLNNLKQRILGIVKQDNSDNYKVFISEDNKRPIEDRSIIIDKINLFKGKTALEILTYLSSLEEYKLQRMFEEQYESVKKVIDEFCQIKKEYLLNANHPPLTDETIKLTLKDTKILHDICKRHFVKITISRHLSKCTKNIIERISFNGNKLLNTGQILENIGFSNNNTCFKSIISLVKNLKIKNLWNDISSLFKTYFLGDKGIDDTIDTYKDKIIKLYRSYGFINVRIPHIDVIKNNKLNKISVTYSIDEGTQFFINSIKIDGNDTFKEEYLLSLIKVVRGDAFNIQKLHDSVFGTTTNMMMDGLKALYNNHGFLNCNISIKTKYAGNKVDIVLQINEGEKSKVGIVRVYGNKYTDENYFKSYTMLSPSEDFAVNKLAMSQQGLSQSELINKEKIFLNPVMNAVMENSQDISCTIQERLLPRLTFNFNYSPDFHGGGNGIKIFLIAGFNNLNLNKFFHITDPQFKWLGKRHTVEVDASVMPSKELQEMKKHSYDITVSFSIPETFRVLQRDVGFGSNFSLSQSYSSFEIDNDEWTNDINKEIVRNVSFHTYFSWNNFNRTKTFSFNILNVDYKWNVVNLGNESKKLLNIPIITSFRFCNIDRSFFVTRGVDFFVSVSFVNPIFAFIDSTFLQKNIKTIIYLGCYFKLVENVVFNFSHYLGLTKPFSNTNPAYFKLSGSGILETYMDHMQYTSFFLKCIDEDDINFQFLNDLKHRIAQKINCELRFKIIEMAYFGFSLFGFFNAGTLYAPIKERYFPTDGFPIFSATGVGIRLNVPLMGVLCFAVGFDCKTGQPNASFTIRQDFETIF